MTAFAKVATLSRGPMLKLIKKLLPETFKKDLKDHLGVPSLRWSLKNLQRAGYDPAVVYDVGAYEGSWTRDFLEVYPQAEVYMFEAQEKKAARLKEITAALPRTHYAIALLGESDGLRKPLNQGGVLGNCRARKTGNYPSRRTSTPPRSCPVARRF